LLGIIPRNDAARCKPTAITVKKKGKMMSILKKEQIVIVEVGYLFYG
jgi:hypothetical protein